MGQKREEEKELLLEKIKKCNAKITELIGEKNKIDEKIHKIVKKREKQLLKLKKNYLET